MALGGDSPPRVTYVLVELDDLEAVFAPIKTASRVKYTCFDISRRYIAFGTSAGGVVLLQHNTLSYLRTLAVKEGPVCQVAISPDESMVAFATSRGVTVVMEHNADRGTTPPQRLQLSYEHKGSAVTALQWNISSTKVFVGDEKGKVSATSVTTSRARNIFQIPTATLVKLDSRVVQLDYAQDHLLVSTLVRCYLCNTSREQFLQIGKKLRDGEYGACFYPGYKSNDPCTIYSARPGSRMWEATIKGEVQCTHQFKTALAVRPEKVLSFRNEEVDVESEAVPEEAKPHAAAFNKLLLLWPSSEDMPFIFTWSDHGCYVFDPKQAEVILWTEDLKGVKDVKCQGSDVYVHFQDGRFSKYILTSVEHAVCRLYQQGLAVQSAQLLLMKQATLCASRISVHVPPAFLLDMLQRVSDMGRTYLFQSLSSVFNRLGLSPDKLSQSSRSSSAMSEPVRLGSGMYVINRLARDVEEALPSAGLSRWRSASPVFRHTTSSSHSSPSRQSGSSSPQRKRSGTLPSGKPKDVLLRSSSAAVSGDTPDSVDSETSGKTSDMSDEVFTSIADKEAVPVQVQSPLSAGDRVKTVESDSEAGDKKEMCEELPNGMQHSPSSALDTKLTGQSKSRTSETTGLKINLNLSDLSKAGAATGKRVSFQPPPGTSMSRSPTNATDSAKNESEGRKDVKTLVNGFDSDSKGYDLAEDAFSALYPDALYEETYRYMNMSLYGMMLPTVDLSLIFSADRDLQNLKESLANKLSSGKNLLKRGLEHLKQSQLSKPELLDVRPKVCENLLSPRSAESEGTFSERQEEKSFWSFLPAFDASALIEASKVARSKVREPEVLFNSAKLVTVLEEWLVHLHAAQRTVVASIYSYCQSSYSGLSHSGKDDDTIKSTCSQVTSTGSTPSENGDPSDRLETEEASISEPKSGEDERHIESVSSLNTEVSDSSTLKTESLQKLLSMDEFVFVHDPFRLSKEDHEMLSELVMLCFQSKTFGDVHYLRDAVPFKRTKGECDIKNTMDTKNHLAHESSMSTDGLRDSLDISQDRHSSDIPDSAGFPVVKPAKRSHSYEFSVQPQEAHPDVVSSAKLSSESPNLDLFVQNYYHFMDIRRLREVLLVWNESCLTTWSMMLRGASMLNNKDEFTQKVNMGQLDAAANLLERNYSGAVLISHLLRLFRAKPSRTIELCLHRSYHVTPLDVLYLSKSCNMLPEFLNYMNHVIDCLPVHQQAQVLEKLLHLDEVRYEWMSNMLQEGSSPLLKCKCGWPRPGAHLHSWRYSNLLLHIIKTSVNMYEKLLNLCFSCGFWKGYLWLAGKLQLRDIHQKTVVHLADVTLLSDSENIGYLPNCDEEWKQLLCLVGRLNSCKGCVTCVTCSEKHSTETQFDSCAESGSKWETTLHWESVATLALSKLGPLSVVPLLQSTEVSPGVLPSSFYRSIILSYLMDKQQSALTHRMLSSVGSYLWSRRPVSYSPEVHQALQDKKQQAARQQGDDNDTVLTVGRKLYLEEPESCWGRRTCLKRPCRMCKLPLTSHLSAGSGITVCPCGHTYHTACLPEGMCAVCSRAPGGSCERY